MHSEPSTASVCIFASAAAEPSLPRDQAAI
jgi:hypothetical protein